jgi:hypothetical protein
MANGNPSFGNADVYVGAASVPDKLTGSSKMAMEDSKIKEEDKKMTENKQTTMTLKEFHQLVRDMVKEAIQVQLNEGKLPPWLKDKAKTKGKSQKEDKEKTKKKPLSEVKDPETGMDMNQIMAKIKGAKDQKEMGFWVGKYHNLNQASM